MKPILFLIAGLAWGCFSFAPSVRAQCNAGWSALGAGVNGPVYALTAWDHDGSSSTPDWLAAGGSFTMAGGVTASNIAVFDGSRWMALEDGIQGTVNALYQFDFDSGGQNPPTLVIGGDFESPLQPGNFNIAFWQDGSWQPAGTLISPGTSFTQWDPDGDGPGLSLVAGIESPPGAPPVLRWNGNGWDYLGQTSQFVNCFDLLATSVPFGGFQTLYAIGNDPNNYLFGSRVWALGTPVSNWGAVQNRSGPGYALAIVDPDNNGPSGSYFATAGLTPGDWYANISWLLGYGPAFLHAPNQAVYDMLALDPDGAEFVHSQELFAAGIFTQMIPTVPFKEVLVVNRITRWDGAEWHPLDGPVGTGVNAPVFTLASWDRDGDGPQAPSVVAGGNFTMAGGMPASHVAAWNLCAPHPSEPCFGDANIDGTVGFPDLATVLANWGTICP